MPPAVPVQPRFGDQARVYLLYVPRINGHERLHWPEGLMIEPNAPYRHRNFPTVESLPVLAILAVLGSQGREIEGFGPAFDAGDGRFLKGVEKRYRLPSAGGRYLPSDDGAAASAATSRGTAPVRSSAGQAGAGRIGG